MSKRTVVNDQYKGLVESFAIPAELHQRGDHKFATYGTVCPIHCCDEQQILEKAAKTHHYCDIFTEQVMEPLGELAYVRLDENTAEKVFINRSKRVLVTSSDGRLAQWRCAPTFESANRYLAGAPVVNKDGGLVSVVTACRGNHYAVSTFEGEGGYFETSQPWEVLDIEEGKIAYGDKTFDTREELRQYVETLPPAEVTAAEPGRPLLLRGRVPRIVLVARNGRQLMHQYLHGVIVHHVDYL